MGAGNSQPPVLPISMERTTSHPAHPVALETGCRSPVHLFHEQDHAILLAVFTAAAPIQWLLMASSRELTSEVHCACPPPAPTSDWRLIRGATVLGMNIRLTNGPDGLIKSRSNCAGENSRYSRRSSQSAQTKGNASWPLDTRCAPGRLSVQQAGLLLHNRDQGLITLEVQTSSSATKQPSVGPWPVTRLQPATWHGGEE